MGWHYEYLPGVRSRVDIACSMIGSEFRAKVVCNHTVGSTVYFAYRDFKGLVRAMVVLTHIRGEYAGIKVMEEDEGPYYYDVPKSFLDKLSPTDNKNANDWRQACRDKLAQRLRSGARVVLQQELLAGNMTFCVGESATVVRQSANSILLDFGAGRRLKTRWPNTRFLIG